MQTPEARVKKDVKRVLELCNAYYFLPVTGGYGSSGVPDIIACINGQFVAVECKAKGNKPTKLQLRNLQEIADVNGLAFVVDETSIGTFSLKLSVELALPSSKREGKVIDLTRDETTPDE